MNSHCPFSFFCFLPKWNVLKGRNYLRSICYSSLTAMLRSGNNKRLDLHLEIGGVTEPLDATSDPTIVKTNSFVLVNVKSNRWQIYPDFPHSYNTDQMAAIVTFDKSGKRY